MWTVLVDLRVRPDRLPEFFAAIEENAKASVRDEPGCLLFDVHRSADDPFRFLLYEVYRDREAFEVEHRATSHYAAWNFAAERCLESGARTNTYFAPVRLTWTKGAS